MTCLLGQKTSLVKKDIENYFGSGFYRFFNLVQVPSDTTERGGPQPDGDPDTLVSLLVSSHAIHLYIHCYSHVRDFSVVWVYVLNFSTVDYF